MRKRHALMAVAIISMAVPSVTLADPGDHYLPLYGGNGGQFFLDDVSSGFMVGFHLRYGQYVDRLSWLDQAGLEGPGHGGNGGQEIYTSCPSGWVTKGIYGKAQTYVDRIGLICVHPSSGSTSLEPSYGQNGGTAFDSRCVDGEFAVGIQGRAQALLDKIGLICNAIGR
jgi:hypothetical protein